MVMEIDLYSSCLLMLILGVGNTKGNREEDSEDEAPEQMANTTWIRLLNESDGVYSLKPLEEVLDIKANKISMGCALREFIRQAWGEYYLTVKNSFPYSNFGYPAQSGRMGRVTWGKIKREPLGLIHPRFLLDVDFENPTRMNLIPIKLYWEAWALLEVVGHPFSFLSIREEEEEEEEEPHSQANKTPTEQFAPPVFDEDNLPIFDDGIPLPCQCNTSALCTICL